VQRQHDGVGAGAEERPRGSSSSMRSTPSVARIATFVPSSGCPIPTSLGHRRRASNRSPPDDRPASGGRPYDGAPARVDLAVRVLRVRPADRVDVAVEVALRRSGRSSRATRARTGQRDVRDPLAAALLYWPVTNGVAASASAPSASIARCALYGISLHDPERVVGERAVAGVDRARRPDLAARRVPSMPASAGTRSSAACRAGSRSPRSAGSRRVRGNRIVGSSQASDDLHALVRLVA
jgi:hypothetical protein